MVYHCVVHSTTNVAVRCTNGNEEFRGHCEADQAGAATSSQKAASKASSSTPRRREGASTARPELRQGQGPGREPRARSTARLASLSTLWTRPEPGQPQAAVHPRASIAQAAIRIADAEGFDALSMRRLAAELDAGTMTLYHYVRTKDELLTLVNDAVMGEVILPEGDELPTDWREAIVA